MSEPTEVSGLMVTVSRIVEPTGSHKWAVVVEFADGDGKVGTHKAGDLGAAFREAYLSLLHETAGDT